MTKTNTKTIKLTETEAYVLLGMLEHAGYDRYEENSYGKTVYDAVKKQIKE